MEDVGMVPPAMCSDVCVQKSPPSLNSKERRPIPASTQSWGNLDHSPTFQISTAKLGEEAREHFPKVPYRVPQCEGQCMERTDEAWKEVASVC